MTRIVLAALVAVAASGGSARAATGTTLENLQAAFNGESNANARYTAFAAKADAEGYKAVGQLFRAAARSEAIHARNHAAVIKALGGTPKADVAAPTVKSTRENLLAAVAGESYERDTMYPDFLARARQDGKADAVRTLDLARKAEIGHAKLYQAALDGLDGQKTAGPSLYVCAVCGFTVRGAPATACPSSGTAKEKFERVD